MTGEEKEARLSPKPRLDTRALGRKTMRPMILTGGLVAALVLSSGVALAQKSGGVLKMYHRDNPPSASIHEEATNSTVLPFMSLFNNLVLYDQQAAEQPADHRARPRQVVDAGAPTARSSPSSCRRA